MKEKRKQPRVNVIMPVAYYRYQYDEKPVEQKMGVILDVSQEGMLIESETVINANYVKIVFVNYENVESSIVGFVIYSRRAENGKAKTGLCFHGEKDEIYTFVTNLIRTYQFMKK